jgi:hypothetical protein
MYGIAALGISGFGTYEVAETVALGWRLSVFSERALIELFKFITFSTHLKAPVPVFNVSIIVFVWWAAL